MEEIRDKWGEPAGKDLYFIASMTDYYYLETLTATAVTHVYEDGMRLKVLGKNIRTFKPGVPFNIQVSDVLQAVHYYLITFGVLLTFGLLLIMMETEWKCVKIDNRIDI